MPGSIILCYRAASELTAVVQITVDGDTSTNDTCIGLASGAAGNDIIKHSTSEAAQKLEAAVTALLQVGQPLRTCVCLCRRNSLLTLVFPFA